MMSADVVEMSMATVLLGDRRPGNLRVMREALARAGHTGVGMDGRAAIEAAADGHERPLVGIVDLAGLGRDAVPVCEGLRERNIPFVVLATGRTGPVRPTTLTGAAGILQKPIDPTALLELVGMLAGEGEAGESEPGAT